MDLWRTKALNKKLHIAKYCQATAHLDDLDVPTLVGLADGLGADEAVLLRQEVQELVDLSSISSWRKTDFE